MIQVGIHVLDTTLKPTIGHRVEDFNHFQPELAYCPSKVESECTNATDVTIKTCGCPKGKMGIKGPGKDLMCEVMSSEVSKQLLNNYELPLASRTF